MHKSSWPIFSIAVTVLALSWLVYYASSHSSTVSPAIPADWQTSQDEATGISFRYPANLNTTYITAQDWPPTVQLVTATPCPTEANVINGRSFCVQAETGAAAGSVYTTYHYTATITKQPIELSFTLRFTQCRNYGALSEQTACEQERTSFNVDQFAAQIFSTITLASTPMKQSFGFPLDQALARITKKPFGIYITPATSPVQPERFTGYHTGTDFEIFPNETDAVVSVKAICAGTVRLKQWVSGYGGVLVQSCSLNDQPITVLYGHLDPSGSTLKVGDSISLGQTIGQLGQGYSHATDGERKHLHLSVHQGSQVDLLGYVSTKTELAQWIDVATLWK